MNQILKSVIKKFALVYLDDAMLYSTSKEQHVKHIEIVLELLKKAGLKIKLSVRSYKRQLFDSDM
jgi:hypothetical protein